MMKVKPQTKSANAWKGTPIRDRYVEKAHNMAASTTIYRYMSLEQLIGLGESQTLTLRRIMDWEDPNEGYYVRQFYSVIEERQKDEKEAAKVRSQHNNLEKRAYGICFTDNPESDAQWRVYSKGSTCIQIKSTIAALENIAVGSQIECMFGIGKIQYKDFRLEVDPRSLNMTAYFVKLPAFSYEQEVRLVIMLIESGQKKDYPHVLRFPIKKDFISGIVIDPRADERAVEIIRQYCASKECLKDIPVEQSTLYKPFRMQ